jgi:lipid-binding SYLF domain-containing protein
MPLLMPEPRALPPLEHPTEVVVRRALPVAVRGLAIRRSEAALVEAQPLVVEAQERERVLEQELARVAEPVRVLEPELALAVEQEPVRGLEPELALVAEPELELAAEQEQVLVREVALLNRVAAVLLVPVVVALAPVAVVRLAPAAVVRLALVAVVVLAPAAVVRLALVAVVVLAPAVVVRLALAEVAVVPRVVAVARQVAAVVPQVVVVTRAVVVVTRQLAVAAIKSNLSATSTILILGCLLVGTVFSQEKVPDKRLDHAANSIREIQSSDKPIPPALLTRAQCIIIIPGLFKGAFLFGGKYGRGFASCRRPGGWSAPAAMIIEGGNFGVQLGGSATDLVLLVMNRDGIDHLLHDKFTLGADLTVVQGMGYSASANSDVFMRAPMISWSRSKGLFVGLSLEGASLRPDKAENRKLYGRKIDNLEILTKRTPVPRGARPLVTALNHFAPRAAKAKK